MIVCSRPNTASPRPGDRRAQGSRRRLLVAVGGAVVALGLASPALADVKAGVDAWAKGDFATAVHEWEGPAARGDADAEFDLGQAYRLGRGVPQDPARAEALFGQAAAKGHLQASDNYGLLVFQRGDHVRAMPYVAGAAGRGDPRAEYLMGIAYFNGDVVGKDWIRAYAFETLAQDAGLEQAKTALTQMDKFIPLEQRQQSVALKADLSQQIEASRNRQVASLELGNTSPQGMAGPPVSAAPPSAEQPYAPPAPQAAPERSYAPPAYSPPNPSNPYSGFPGSSGAPPAPQTAMSDAPPAYTSAPAGPVAQAQAAQPRAMGLPPRPADLPRKHLRPAPVPLAREDSAPQPTASPADVSPPVNVAAKTPSHLVAHAPSGSWKIQLGAFAVAQNADTLWAKARSRPEIAGHPRAQVPTGKVTRLLATGYSEQAARAACAHLTAAGLVCLVTKD